MSALDRGGTARSSPARWLIVTACWLVACACSTAARALTAPPFVTASLIPDPAPQRVSAARDGSDRMTVEVSLNGQGPFAFVIDTGADRTVVSRELAAQLKLESGQPVLLHGTAGADMTPTAHVAELSLGTRTLRELTAPILGAEALGAQGLLGIDSLHDQRMVMDFRRGAMAVEPSRRESVGRDVIVVRAKSRYGQLVLVDASIDGRPLAVIVDSGAQNTIGNLALERQALGPGGSAQAPAGQVLSVSGQTTPARFGLLPQVRLGGVTMRNLPIAFADLHTFAEFDMNSAPAILLGMDVLRHFDRVVVDFGRRQVSFQVPTAG